MSEHWRRFAVLALNHMRWHAQAPYVVTVKEYKLVLIGRWIGDKPISSNDNEVPGC
jgi:hypothetical protein